NYDITYNPGTLTVTPKSLTISGVTATNRVYNGTIADTLNTGSAILSAAVGGDVVTLNTVAATGTFADKDTGNGKAVTAAGFTLSGADAGDYSITQPVGLSANITPAALSLRAVNTSKLSGTSDPTLTYSYTGLAGGDSRAYFSGALARAAGESVGSYAIGQGTLAATGNYYIAAFTPGTFSIMQGVPANIDVPRIVDPIWRGLTQPILVDIPMPVPVVSFLYPDPSLAPLASASISSGSPALSPSAANIVPRYKPSSRSSAGAPLILLYCPNEGTCFRM
ncbi:MAG: hypothetical protein KGJ06_04935, partial [Pseudomonadota bacterium]|nr:hypothetical protein [Pseudomonadota bacterium]